VAASNYLSTQDIATYGLTPVQAAMSARASMTVDAYLRRPEGLVWAPDLNGLPCYMVNKSPRRTILVQAGFTIAPGNSVVVPVQGLDLPVDALGEVLWLDRATPSNTEAVTIQAIAPGELTLSTVLGTHAPGSNAAVVMELGLAIQEEKQFAKSRQLVRTTRPVAALLSVMGRYGYSRRSDQAAGMYQDVNLLAIVSVFGGPPLWVPVLINQVGVAWGTNDELYVPAGMYLAPFNEARITYVSGFSSDSLPDPIKMATATICAALVEQDSTANVQRFRAGQTDLIRFSDQVIPADIKNALRDFKARAFV
jgi:hypothetical protein